MTSPRSQAGSFQDFQKTMMNVVYMFTSVISMPVEMATRPTYGSRYFSPSEQFFSAVSMIFLPLVFGIAKAAVQMLPGARSAPSFGIIGMGGLSTLFFLGSFIHGYRIWQRQRYPEREQCSYFEGPPLPVFSWIPGLSFWKTRLIAEPVAVFGAALFLQNILVIDSTAAHYLQFAALCLAVKSYILWFAEWQLIRDILDAGFIGPAIAKMAQNTETEEERAMLHVASLPDLEPQLKRAFVKNFARAHAVDLANPDERTGL